MPTVNVVLIRAKQDRKGLAPLVVKVDDGRLPKTRSLRVKVKPSRWNADKQEVRRSHPEAEEINHRIVQEKEAVREEIRRRKWTGGDLSAAAVTRAVWETPGEAPPPADFFAYAEAWAATLRAEGRINYYKRAKSILKKFKAYAGAPLPFDRFTPAVLNGHRAYMMNDLGNSANTARVNFTFLRTVMKRAVREGVVAPGDDPFLRFVPPKETRVERAKLTTEDVAAIAALDLADAPDLDRARDLFLFSAYAAGLRFGDAVELRWRSVRSSGGDVRLHYTMSKTGTPREIRLNATAQAILGKYRPEGAPPADGFVFPYLVGYDLSTPERRQSAISSRNVVVNAALKEVARLAGVEAHVSHHVARHTFADLARRKGADTYVVSQALGHANLKVTSRYLAGFDNRAADSAVDIAFG